MFRIPLNIAKDDGDGNFPLLIVAFWVVIAIIGALSKVVSKSRQQRQGPTRPGQKPAREQPPTVDEFLQTIRKMAKGEEPSQQQPRPEQPKALRPAPPPPPPRPVMPLQAGRRPGAPPPPRPPAPQVVPRAPQVPRPAAAPSLQPAATWEPPSPPTQIGPPTARPPTARPPTARPPTAGPPKRKPRVTAEPKPAKKPPVRPVGVPSLADIRAALRHRLAAGPAAMREAILLGEVLGPPIGMRRRRVRRPGGPARLI